MSAIPGTDNGCPDRKTLYIKVSQNRPTITDMIPIPAPHPSTYRTSNLPLRIVCPMICLVLLQYPDEFISNTNVVRNRSTNPDTTTTRVSDVHDTLSLIFPPPDTLSGN